MDINDELIRAAKKRNDLQLLFEFHFQQAKLDVIKERR